MDKTSGGVQQELVRPSGNQWEAFDWLFMNGELDEDTSTFLLNQTMKGRDWICWQVMEPWW